MTTRESATAATRFGRLPGLMTSAVVSMTTLASIFEVAVECGEVAFRGVAEVVQGCEDGFVLRVRDGLIKILDVGCFDHSTDLEGVYG